MRAKIVIDLSGTTRAGDTTEAPTGDLTAKRSNRDFAVKLDADVSYPVLINLIRTLRAVDGQVTLANNPASKITREAAEEKMIIHAEYAKGLTGEIPVLFVREGDTSDELLTLIDEELSISLLVLGADTQSETAGPLINSLMSRGASRCRVPITVVPGNLSDEQLDALF